VQNVVKGTSLPIRPNRRAAFGIDQRNASPPHAAFDDIANPELATDLPHVESFALVTESGGADDYETVATP
jgi:hypothetical protein